MKRKEMRATWSNVISCQHRLGEGVGVGRLSPTEEGGGGGGGRGHTKQNQTLWKPWTPVVHHMCSLSNCFLITPGGAHWSTRSCLWDSRRSTLPITADMYAVPCSFPTTVKKTMGVRVGMGGHCDQNSAPLCQLYKMNKRHWLILFN